MGRRTSAPHVRTTKAAESGSRVSTLSLPPCFLTSESDAPITPRLPVADRLLLISDY